MSDDIFVIGATGFVGGKLAQHFVAEGQRVCGLARTKDAEDSLSRIGVCPVRGDLDTNMAATLDGARAAGPW